MTSAVGGPGVRRTSSGWGWILASGILGVVVGVIALINPRAWPSSTPPIVLGIA